VPALPSIKQWREGPRREPYDANRDATRNEMRSFVCGQCHVEYYCSSKMPLTFPWGKGLSADNIEAFWDETKFPDGEQFSDYTHAETGTKVLKAQHPEFELWNQGIHARSGVSCADCHMPYMREGASKVSDHWVRSPLLNVNRACQTCHRASEEEMKSRVDVIQQRNYDLLQRGGAAIVDLIDALVRAKTNGTAPEALEKARKLQRRAQWRLDYIAAENSMGFHAPQEAAKVLGEAADYARQGQIALLGGVSTTATNPSPAAAPPTSASGAPAAAPSASAAPKK
jgi:nitrite reductase (cytochrome c-552)